MQKLRIFVASPSDMTAERAKVESVALMLKPMADTFGFVVEVIDWSSVAPHMGRPEQVILDQVKPTSWDVFIGILWHRFGTPTGEINKSTGQRYLSGTEEEFQTAYNLWLNYKRPRILMYRCQRPIPPEDLNPDQYKRVKDFFVQFDAQKGSHPGLYQSFVTARSFEKLLFNNLQQLLIELGRDPSTKVILDPKVISTKVFICYKRVAKDDRDLANYLSEQLINKGLNVFIDTSMRVGTKWLSEIDENIRTSDYLIVLVSKDSADSEMVQAEIMRAYEYRNRTGKPKTLPIRMNYEGLLPYSISAFVGNIQQLNWKNSRDNEQVVEEILRVINGQGGPGTVTQHSRSLSRIFSEDGQPLYSEEENTKPLPEFDPRALEDLEEPGGSIKLGDRFYIERNTDIKLKRAIVKNGETITIRASRQTGKSSLLARGINHAHPQASIVYIDLQSVQHDEFETSEKFLKYFANTIAKKLHLDVNRITEIWKGTLDPQVNLISVMEEYILPNSDRQIVLALDEADRLLAVPFQNDFFALMRSWHNNRAIDVQWNKLNLVMVIATEPYLLISNPNQSPFNVGVKLNLEDFNRDQVWDLNHRHGDPIMERDKEAFFELLSGHPYLTRKALYLLVSEGWSWGNLYKQAADDKGPLADHLRHQLWFIQESPAIKAALREVLDKNRCSDDKILWRLLRAGLVKGTGNLYYCRCGLYERYFSEHI